LISRIGSRQFDYFIDRNKGVIAQRFLEKARLAGNIEVTDYGEARPVSGATYRPTPSRKVRKWSISLRSMEVMRTRRRAGYSESDHVLQTPMSWQFVNWLAPAFQVLRCGRSRRSEFAHSPA
jgi:hypothetical protein